MKTKMTPALERAAIVKWLRSGAQLGDKQWYTHAMLIADLIERGEHLNKR